jgi:hypothetical protein
MVWIKFKPSGTYEKGKIKESKMLLKSYVSTTYSWTWGISEMEIKHTSTESIESDHVINPVRIEVLRYICIYSRRRGASNRLLYHIIRPHFLNYMICEPCWLQVVIYDGQHSAMESLNGEVNIPDLSDWSIQSISDIPFLITEIDPSDRSLT